jgi:hypothetical protein
MDERWSDPLVAYWQRMGDRIGQPAPAVVTPPYAGSVRIRAVAVRPEVVTSINAQDLNVVVFEKSLAVANLAAMPRHGGLLLSNNFLYELPAFSLSLAGEIQVGYTDSDDGDRILWYERK